MKNPFINNIDKFQLEIITNNKEKLSKNIGNFIFIVANFYKINANIGLSQNRLLFLHYISSQNNNIIIQGINKSEFLVRKIKVQELINKTFGKKMPQKLIYYMIGINDCKTKPIVGFRKLKISKTIWIEDIQYWQDYVPYIKRCNFQNILLGTVVPKLERVYRNKLSPKKLASMPHSIDINIFKNYNLSKEYDILFYGYVSEKIYPFRTRMYKLLKKNSNKFNIKFVSHPGYSNIKSSKSNNITGVKLAKLINKSYLTICTPSKYNMLLKKYLETGASGSIICGPLPDNYSYLKDHFKVVEINNNMTDEQIINTLMVNLKQKELLKAESIRSSIFISNNFNYQIGYLNLQKKF